MSGLFAANSSCHVSILVIPDSVCIAAALEKLLRNYAGKYATGDEIFLVRIFSNNRF